MKAKLLIITIAFLGILLSNYDSISQCNVQTNRRDDGAIIRYLSPDRIGKCDKFFMGASLQTNGSEFYVATVSVFPTQARNLTGTMTINFSNNKSSVLEHISSQETTFNGYPATLSIFFADENDLKNIKSSSLKYLLVQLDNNIYQTVIVKMNSDILQKQYKCLK